MRARIRTVKPDIFHDEKLWALGVETGLPIYQGFQGLWCYADREGRFEWRPMALKSLILPYWAGDFEALLDELVRAGMVAKYTVEGREYGLVVNLSVHQAFNAREPHSVLPPPPEGTCTHVHARAEHGRNGNGSGNSNGNGSGNDDAAPPLNETTAIVPTAKGRRAGEPPGWWQYPDGWKWSAETSAAALAVGVTEAELAEQVRFWTNRRWSVPCTNLDGELQRSFDGIIAYRKRTGGAALGDAAQGGGVFTTGQYKWTPTDEHRAIAAGRPLSHAVEAYRAAKTPDRFASTLQVNDDFTRRLRHWIDSGEFIAAGPLPSKRQRGAA
jgi:hypothetical protein